MVVISDPTHYQTGGYSNVKCKLKCKLVIRNGSKESVGICLADIDHMWIKIKAHCYWSVSAHWLADGQNYELGLVRTTAGVCQNCKSGLEKKPHKSARWSKLQIGTGQNYKLELVKTSNRDRSKLQIESHQNYILGLVKTTTVVCQNCILGIGQTINRRSGQNYKHRLVKTTN